MIRNKVRYVLAGCEGWGFSHAYVKYEKNNSVFIEKKGGAYLKIHLHDRTVLVTGTGATYKSLPSQFDFDTVVPLISPSVVSEPIVLINPYHASGGFTSNFQPFKKKVIVDSGGFQMLRGTSDYIDLDNLVDFYNVNGDIGMPLDLPLHKAAEPMFFDAVTKYMKANDKYMLSKLNPNVDLALISHGSNAKLRLRRLKQLRRPTQTVAIAGLNVISDMDKNTKNLVGLSNAMAVMDYMRDTTDYFHFLGVTSNFWFVIYALLAGTGYVKTIGGDSVTHRLAAVNGTYNVGLGAGSKMRSMDLLRDRTIPLGVMCRCPTCQVLTDGRLHLDARFLESHTLFNVIETKNLIADAVQSYLNGTTKLREIAEQWSTTGGYPALARAVDYVNLVIQKGYREWLPHKQSSLFAVHGGEKPFSADGVKHFTGILRKYEKFHNEKFLPT